MNAVEIIDPEAKAPSPFLPGTKIQFAWDSTSLGYLKTCPRLYQYLMLDGWSSSDESVHLRFGQELHQAFQDYANWRTDELSHEDALHNVIWDLTKRTGDFRPDETTRAGKYKNRRSLLMAVIDYLDKYIDDPAETFIKADGKPAVELSFRFELDWGPEHQPAPLVVDTGLEYEVDLRPSALNYVNPNTGNSVNVIYTRQPYLLCGHLDRVVSFNGDLFVLDYKTTTTTPGSYYFDQYSPNNQMTLYTLASKVILGTQIKGVIIDAIQILIDYSRSVRGFTYRTPDQLSEWTTDLRYWFSLAEQFAVAGYWPMNDTACDKFGGCRFRQICSKSPQVREQWLKAEFVQLPESERWNPLRSR